MGKLLEELKRRKVFRVAAVYAVVAWVLIQVADTVLPALQMPPWTVSFVTVLFILGFPVAVILAWAYEATPEGIKPDSGFQASAQIVTPQNQTLIYAIFVLLLVAVGFQFADRFILIDEPSSELSDVNNESQDPPTQLSVTLTDDIAFLVVNSGAHGLALSPDGRKLVFTGLINNDEIRERGLVHRDLNQRTLIQIPDTDDAHNPFFSPDSESVGYFTADGQMMRATLDGRPPVRITEAASQFSRGLWVGASIYFTLPQNTSLFRISVEGGPAEEIPFDRQESPTLIRDIIYVQDTGELLLGRSSDDASEITLLNTDTGETQQILSNAKLIGFGDAGFLLFLRDQNLMAARFDVAERRLGFAVPVLEDFAWDVTRAQPQVSLSASGTLGYVVESDTAIPTTLNAIQADGTRTVLAELVEGSAIVKLSPDGQYAAIATDLFPYRVYLWDMTLQVPTGLEVGGITPSWHPEGNHLIFSSRSNVISLDTEDGSEEVILTAPRLISVPSFSSDGETVVFVTTDDNGTSGIYAQLPGETTPRAIIVTEQNVTNPVLSPDGQWLAYDSGSRFTSSVYVAKFPSGTERRRVSTGSARHPTWRSDGKALFFVSTSAPGEPVEMQIVEAESMELESFSAPRVLFTMIDLPFDNPEGFGSFSNWGAPYHVSDDGNQFLIIYRPINRKVDEIAIAQNWLTDLERLLPNDRF